MKGTAEVAVPRHALPTHALPTGVGSSQGEARARPGSGQGQAKVRRTGRQRTDCRF